MMIGSTSSATSVSCHDRTNSTTSENDEQDRRRDELQQPHCTSSAIDSMSAVIRDTSTPDLLRSKKASDWRWMWSNTRMRRMRRNPSPARLTNTYCWRPPR